MRHSIEFAVLNNVRVSNTWPIRLDDRLFFIKRDGETMKSVGVVFENVPIKEAPTIKNGNTDDSTPKISFPGRRALIAERDIRAWQSLIATYQYVDIDYDSKSEEFIPETEGERENIQIYGLTLNRGTHEIRHRHEFAILGRAFLAYKEGHSIIEMMAFYLEATKARAASRYIDAYNYFYLFLESNFHLKLNNRDAAVALAQNEAFRSAVTEFINDSLTREIRDQLKFSAISVWSEDPLPLALEIVKLRGFLRHHSLGNPNRWDPTEQGKYTAEASFLGASCQSIASPDSFDKTWERQYGDAFLRISAELGRVINVSVVLTITDDGQTRDVGLNLAFPFDEPSPLLAKSVMEKCLAELDQRSPGAELLGIRARVGPKGPELLRYDLGPSIGRSPPLGSE